MYGSAVILHWNSKYTLQGSDILSPVLLHQPDPIHWLYMEEIQGTYFTLTFVRKNKSQGTILTNFPVLR